MQSDRRIVARLRAENMVLRALIVELGGKPPAALPYAAAAQGSLPVLQTLAQLAQRGL